MSGPKPTTTTTPTKEPENMNKKTKTKREAKPSPCVYVTETEEEDGTTTRKACGNTTRTRGLCHAHYQGWRRGASRWEKEQAQAKKEAREPNLKLRVASDEDLIERGLVLANGGGGSPVACFDGFQFGSTVRGLSAGPDEPAETAGEKLWREKFEEAAGFMEMFQKGEAALKRALIQALGSEAAQVVIDQVEGSKSQAA